MRGCGGGEWLPGGVCGCWGGACVVAGGTCGCRGARMVAGGGGRGIRSMSGRYASYWNAFLFENTLK